MFERSRALRIRDFGCGELLTVAAAGAVSLHYYARDSTHRDTNVEHEYPSHSLVFTDSGAWEYHGAQPQETVDNGIIVAGEGRAQYVCSHPRGFSAKCFIVAIANDVFDEDKRVFCKSTLRLTPEMLFHRRVIMRSIEEPERLESIAFSLYDFVARIGSRSSKIPSNDIRMAYAKRVIEDVSSEHVSVSDIAKLLQLSRFSFSRRFLTHSGMTPHAYMTSVRIARAKHQLQKSSRTINEIAAASGFSSFAHFSSAFHRIVGTTPSDYRRVAGQSGTSQKYQVDNYEGEDNAHIRDQPGQ